MQGRLGHEAWRWLFYIEGAMTVAVALVAIFVLPDFPLTTNWLTPAERHLAELRMEEDAGVVDEVRDGDNLTGWSMLDDRKTMMDLFGGDSGWHLGTGKRGGCVSHKSLV